MCVWQIKREKKGGGGRRLIVCSCAQRFPPNPPPPHSDRPYTPDYAGFVKLSREIVRGRSSEQQRATVAAVLASLLPPGGPERFRASFPLSKWSAEANAFFTKVGFGWLVGPMETIDVEVDLAAIGLSTDPSARETWRSGVRIEKCRYLEASGCVGLCVNLCKRPTEAFFADAFGLPLHMVPNAEDLSCEMKFGVIAPPIEQDDVYNMPCYVGQCSMAAPSGPCPKVDTERGQKEKS